MTGVFVESVTSVEPLSGCEFELVFNTGEKRVFDTVPYLGRGILPSAARSFFVLPRISAKVQRALACRLTRRRITKMKTDL